MRELIEEELGYISGGRGIKDGNKFELDVVESKTVKALPASSFQQFNSHSEKINRNQIQLDCELLSKQRSRYRPSTISYKTPYLNR